MAYVGKKPQPFYLGQVDDLNVASDVTVDTDTLVVDATNDRVGVNQPSPAEALDIIGDVILSTTGSLDVGVLHFGDTPDETKIIGRGPLHATAPDTIDFVTNTATAMTIDSSGNVGIGTSSPLGLMHGYSAAGNAYGYLESGSGAKNALMWFRNADCASLGGYVGLMSDEDLRLWNSESANIVFGTNNAERMRINSSGYVSVNDTSGTFSGRTFQFGIERGGSGPNDCLSLYYATTGTTSQIIRGHSNVGGTETAVFIVRTDGDVQNTNNSYTAISDERLKQDIVAANSQWDDIKALQVKNYRLKDRVAQSGDDAPTHLGLIAQDLEASGMSGLVTTYETEYWEEGEDLPEGVSVGDVKTEEVKTVKYSILYMKAVKALQEAMERIETLETTQADLVARIEALEAN